MEDVAAQSAHAEGVRRLLNSYRAIPAGASVRLAKPTSNLFRARAKRAAPGLDVSGLANVVSVDPHGQTADVAGMCTYENLVAATLPFGLSPLVVPQLKTITLGGAAVGKSPIMPASPDLDAKPEVVDGLVKIIRKFGS